MCNSTDPAAAAAADLPPCPPWCDPRFCEVTPGHVIHSSVPVHLETVSAAYRVHLIRYDERRFPAEWGGEPTVRLDVESHDEAVPGSDGAPLRLAADVALSEVLPLIGALAGQFALAGGVS